MKLTQEKVNGTSVLAVEGRVHGTHSTDFQEQLMTLLLAQPERIVFDLAKMTRVDSLGLRAFIMANNQIKNYGGKMILCDMQRIVEDVFDISGFSNFFLICKNREEAIARVEG